MHGVDWDGPAVAEDDEEQVTVPQGQILPQELLNQLETMVDPLEENRDNGMELYMRTKAIVSEMNW